MSGDDYLKELFQAASRDRFTKEAAKAAREQAEEVDKYGDGKSGSKDINDFFDFFAKAYPNSRKCMLRNVVFTKDIDRHRGWSPIENFRKVIEADCQVAGLSVSHVERHLAKWCNVKPPELLVDIPKWDGKDHIKDALQRIKVENVSHEHFVELMKDWFTKAVMRMKNPKNQNRLVIFRGSQGIGKDFCIRAMTSGFGMYTNEIDFANSKTEIFRVIKNLAIGIIPEFDETHKASLATIKSVITVESIEMRALYKNESESIPIRTSFISASNFSNILRDTSGNRRFMIFDLSEIEHTFEQVDGEQIAAQAIQLAAEGFKASKEAEMAMRGIIEAETPEDPENKFIEEMRLFFKQAYAELYDSKSQYYHGKIVAGSENLPDKLRWYQVGDEVMNIAKKYGYKQQRVWSLLKRNALSHADHKTTWYGEA